MADLLELRTAVDCVSQAVALGRQPLALHSLLEVVRVAQQMAADLMEVRHGTGIPVPRGPMDFPAHSRHTRVSGSTGGERSEDDVPY